MRRLVQILHPERGRRVALVDEPDLRLLRDCDSVYGLASRAIESRESLQAVVERLVEGERIAYDTVYENSLNRTDTAGWRLLPPIDHPEPSRCFVTGTGLTHKGSAENRQSMHVATAARRAGAGVLQASPTSAPPTDSMKMFQLGLDGGRPAPGCIGAAPEWFYKGIGTSIRAHGEPLTVPNHGFDGGDEAEIAGVYLIGPNGMPYRIGFVQGNEFSDHVLESKNYLYLAQSKLRDCAIGPELVLDPKFEDVPGRATVERRGATIWEGAQSTGERSMCHTVANLEHHHFKHSEHRHTGDIHIHFFGADLFSFKDRLELQEGDVMTVAFEGFGRALRNPIHLDRSEAKYVPVKSL